MLSDIPFQTFVNLNTSGIVTQIKQLESQVSQIQQNKKAWTSLQYDGAAALTAFQGLGLGATWDSKQSTSSNTGVLTAAVDNSAQAGTYAFSVTQLAQQQIDGTASTAQTITSSTASLGLSATTMTFSVAGTTYSVSVNSSTSLASIASAINGLSGPVSAQVEQSASGNYYLQMFGSQTDQPIAFTGASSAWADVGLMTSTASGYTVNVVQQAQGAAITMGSNSYTSSTNTFSNVIPGTTLTAIAPGSSTITVTNNTQSMVGAVKSAVSAWNQWVSDTYKLAFGTLPPTSSTSTTLQSNPNQVIQSPSPMFQVNMIEQAIAGFTNSGITSGGMGLAVGQNNQPLMKLNTASLSAEIQSNPSAVKAFFTHLASTVDPMIQSFSQGAQSVTGTAITNKQNTITQDNQGIAQLTAQYKQQQKNAVSLYQSFQNTLSQIARESQVFGAMTKSGSTSGIL